MVCRADDSLDEASVALLVYRGSLGVGMDANVGVCVHETWNHGFAA